VLVVALLRLTLLRNRLARHGRWVVWLLVLAGGLLMLYPAYWVFVTAISPAGLAQSGGFSLWPHRIDLGVFGQAIMVPIQVIMVRSSSSSPSWAR